MFLGSGRAKRVDASIITFGHVFCHILSCHARPNFGLSASLKLTQITNSLFCPNFHYFPIQINFIAQTKLPQKRNFAKIFAPCGKNRNFGVLSRCFTTRSIAAENFSCRIDSLRTDLCFTEFCPTAGSDTTNCAIPSQSSTVEKKFVITPHPHCR